MPIDPGAIRKHLEALTQSDEPGLREAAQRLLDSDDALAFASPDLKTRMLAYCSIEPPAVAAAIENLEAFCAETAQSDDPFAKKSVKCFVDRVTADWFKIDRSALASIGIILGNSEYKEQGTRCLNRAALIM